MATINFNCPIRLETSRAWRTYLGGKCISRLHGEEGEDGHFPEEWLMSTITARNVGREDIIEGISRVAGSDMTLADLIAAHPVEMLGQKHIAAHGNATGVLVKLLDAAERLGVQVHPTRPTAKRLFNSEFGKTECWYIIDERTIDGTEPYIYLGFREGVTREMWKDCFDRQDIPAMLDCLHRFKVKKGDTFIVRGGVPHAIGSGCFLVEIQEPTDYTIRTERTTVSGLRVADATCHQGIGFEKMFDCFEYDGASEKKTLDLYKVKPITETHGGYTVTHVIYPEVTDMFALDVVEVTGTCTLPADGRFYGIYFLDGEGTIGGEPTKKCDHFFVPASAGEVTLTAGKTPLRFIRCFGPEK